MSEADIIILAVKPWLVEEVMEEIRPSIRKEKQIIVSVAAGVTLNQLAEMAVAPSPWAEAKGASVATPMRKEHWFATKKTLLFPRSAACSL